MQPKSYQITNVAQAIHNMSQTGEERLSVGRPHKSQKQVDLEDGNAHAVYHFEDH